MSGFRMPATITNIAAYRFAPLTELKLLRERLLAACRGWGLKGTILLSPEGINLFVAGGRAEVDLLLAALRAVPGLEGLAPKFSESAQQPFRRMLVRLKKEIIAFGVDGIDPARYTSPRLEARELKRWLDEGRPVVLLDTRNDYEVRLGTFKGALPVGVDHFRDFPEAVRRLPEYLKQLPVVSFCTGGIRCEKAAPFLEREGFQQVWQLEGGILKYFEEVGGDHYEGECFVFDQRVGLDPGLHETGSSQCFRCQTPLSAAEQQDERFVHGVSCPYCFKTSEERMRERLAARHEALRRAAEPLPGSVAYDNVRPISVPAGCEGRTLIDALATLFAHMPRSEWLQLMADGRLLDAERRPVLPDRIVRAGERYWRLLPATVEPAVSAAIRILHEDEALVVVDKPAPLPMHPGGRYNRNTLQFLLNAAYHPQKLRAAHRLDANTTGLVLVARTQHFASLLQPQFARGEVEKVYLVRVLGHPAEDCFISEAPISAEPAELGCREVDADGGQAARTDFHVLRRDADGTALLEARPRTGRTNQIRVHLWQFGHPVAGDRAYLPERRRGEVQTLAPGDPPLCLHAWRLTFTHPLTGQRMAVEAARPDWA